jgi:hypothetical protein
MDNAPNHDGSLGDGPFGAATDEAISAALDGELADFAAERNMSEADVRAQLEAWDGYAARAAALDHPRAVLTAPPLDEITRAALVRNAMAAGTKPTQRTASPQRWWYATAAAVLIVVGAGVVWRSQSSAQPTAGRNAESPATNGAVRNELDFSPDPNSARPNSAAGVDQPGRVSTGPTIARGTAANDFGDLTDPTALGALARANADTKANASAPKSAADALSPASSGATPAAQETTNQCALPNGAMLITQGIARYEERIVTVVVANTETVVLATLIDPATCATLAQQSVPIR